MLRRIQNDNPLLNANFLSTQLLSKAESSRVVKWGEGEVIMEAGGDPLRPPTATPIRVQLPPPFSATGMVAQTAQASKRLEQLKARVGHAAGKPTQCLLPLSTVNPKLLAR